MLGTTATPSDYEFNEKRREFHDVVIAADAFQT